MKNKLALATAVLLAAATAACGGGPRVLLPSGSAAYETIPVKAMDEIVAQQIRPGDRLSVRVFGEPELTADNYRVEATGFVQIPLVGQLVAAGNSPEQLRVEITRRLAARFVRDPQVSVVIYERATMNVAVEGQVEKPGVYEIDSSTTLLGALALAQSPDEDAKLDEVMVFRVIDGKRVGGRFDVRDIRAGRADDPQIIGGDTVVVGFDPVKGVWHDFLKTAPLFNLFYIFK